MKPASRNRFLASLALAFRNPYLSPAIVVVATVIGTNSAHAVDYNFGFGAQDLTIIASDQARGIGAGASVGTGFSDNGWGSVFDRGADRDTTYMHFNLASLAGLTINGSVNLNLTINAQYGGAINSGVVGSANSAWSYPGTTPGFTAISGADPSGSYSTGQTATAVIDNTTFQGFVNNLATFHGLAITAGTDSKAHFSGPASLSVNCNEYSIRVLGATDWSTATYDGPSKTLTVPGANNVTGGNLIVRSGATLSVGGSATLDSGTFAGTFDNSGTLAFGSSANQTLNGAISGSGSLERAVPARSPSTLVPEITIAGVHNQNLTGGLSIQGGTVSLDSQFIRMGSVTVEDGGTLLATVPWATGSSNPWFSGRSVGSITVNTGGILTTSSGVNGNHGRPHAQRRDRERYERAKRRLGSFHHRFASIGWRQHDLEHHRGTRRGGNANFRCRCWQRSQHQRRDAQPKGSMGASERGPAPKISPATTHTPAAPPRRSWHPRNLRQTHLSSDDCQ